MNGRRFLDQKNEKADGAAFQKGVKVTGDLFVLQFAQFGPMGPMLGTAKISKIKFNGTIETIAENFGPAAGIALDNQGNLYATHLFFSQLLKWNGVASGVFETPKSSGI